MQIGGGCKILRNTDKKIKESLCVGLNVYICNTEKRKKEMKFNFQPKLMYFN